MAPNPELGQSVIELLITLCLLLTVLLTGIRSFLGDFKTAVAAASLTTEVKR